MPSKDTEQAAVKKTATKVTKAQSKEVQALLNEGGKKQDLDSESEEDPNEERLKNEEDREDIKDYY